MSLQKHIEGPHFDSISSNNTQENTKISSKKKKIHRVNSTKKQAKMCDGRQPLSENSERSGWKFSGDFPWQNPKKYLSRRVRRLNDLPRYKFRAAIVTA